jgi:hypothetical protein
MPEVTPQSLADLLARQELRIRTGVLELPVTALGIEAQLAVGLDVGHSDICSWLVDRAPLGRLRLGLRWEGIVRHLETLLLNLALPGKCIWISGIDVLLAGIAHDDRSRFWQFMRSTFRPSRGLLLSMPEEATHLLSSDERALWLEYGRLSRLETITRVGNRGN